MKCVFSEVCCEQIVFYIIGYVVEEVFKMLCYVVIEIVLVVEGCIVVVVGFDFVVQWMDLDGVWVFVMGIGFYVGVLCVQLSFWGVVEI